MRRRRIGLAVIAFALVFGLSSEVRRVLENAYVGAPFALAANAVRLHLNPHNDAACLDRLAAIGLPFTRLDDADFPADCPVIHAIALEAPLGAKRFMTCGLAAALLGYWQHALQPLARRELGAPLVRIDDLGVRNCRPMTGHRFLLSEHAFANGIDLSAFTLADGSTVRVADDWNGDDPRARFLHAAARQACRFFSMVITPDHDPEHRDHVHVDMGIVRGCLVDTDATRAARRR